MHSSCLRRIGTTLAFLGFASILPATAGAQTPVYVTQWGSGGSGDGQFSVPQGIATDADGNVYVADGYNNRIQKFTGTGDYITQWGSAGSGDGQFSYPWAVATDSAGNVYVADEQNNRIQKFTSTGTYLTQWGGFSWPRGVATDAAGNVYVVDGPRVQKFTSTGTYITQWGSSGSGDGEFSSAQAIATDADGNVYVAEGEGPNQRIQKFTGTGTFLTKWGGPGSGISQFNDPYGLGTDPAGNVYVPDTRNHRIQKFTNTGTYVIQWGSSGNGNGEFIYPVGAVTDAAGNLFVLDQGNNRIQKFRIAGIGSIADVGNDQGRHVRISFFPSAQDSPGSQTPVIQYEAFRRIDPLAAVGAVPAATGRSREPDVRIHDSQLAGMRSNPKDVLSSGWEFVGAIPAHQEAGYNMIVPTLADSSVESGIHWSVFFIRAATSDPGTFFDVVPDSGYSVDNLAPNVPQNFLVTGVSGNGDVQLAWTVSQDEDFRYYSLYRGTDPSFVPGVANRVAQLTEASYVDPEAALGGLPVYYKLSATDFAGNEGGVAVADLVTPVTVEDLEASSTESGVRLAWRLSVEAQRELVGVRVQRADSPEGLYADRTDAPQQPEASMSFDDANVEFGRTYWYRLVLSGQDRNESVSRAIQVTVADASLWRTELRVTNDPSSSGPIEIRFRVARSTGPVRLGIYDVSGRVVSRLDQGGRDAGEYVRSWDRRDTSGARAARGVYLVRLDAGNNSITKKLVLMRE